MSAQTVDEVIPSMLAPDIELIIESRLQELRQYESAPAQTIFMKGKIDGPYENNKALLEISCREDIVTAKLKIQKWDLSDLDADEIEYGETALSAYGEDYGRYAVVVGETVANELGCKPDTLAETVHEKDEIEFVQFATPGESYFEPNAFTVFACEFDTHSFWELDDLWD